MPYLYTNFEPSGDGIERADAQFWEKNKRGKFTLKDEKLSKREYLSLAKSPPGYFRGAKVY